MNLFNDHLNLSNNIYDNAKILKSIELNKQQELVNRNPTAKYYQTLTINLQEQVQYLTRRLNESNAIVPTVFHRDDMSSSDLDKFDRHSPQIAGHTGQRTTWQWINFMDSEISQRFLKYIRNNPRLFAAEVLGLVGGRYARAADRIALLLTSPELQQLAEQVFKLTGPQMASLIQSILNGTASQSDLAAFNAFWNLVWEVSTGWIPSASDFNLNAGTSEGSSSNNSGDGSYRGTGGGIFYQPPLPTNRRLR